MILAGDVGGTKTHLGLFDEKKGLEPVAIGKYISADYASLSEIVRKFLTDHASPVNKACFGIAGPIVDGRCRATNLAWVIDAKELAQELRTDSVWLLNDLEANGWGLKILPSDQMLTLHTGGANGKKGNKALISSGTGLGEAGLYWDGQKHHPFAGEGGHTDFAPRDELEMELFRYLYKKFGHVSYERVLSGPGLYNLYRFLIDMHLEKELDRMPKRFAMEDPPKVITDEAIKKGCKACTRAVEWFVSIYGSEAGNLALKLLALEGVYIGGGIAPKISKFMGSQKFLDAFTSKGRFAELLSSIPIYLILNENIGLLGAVQYAREK